jgi:hypothetical protein
MQGKHNELLDKKEMLGGTGEDGVLREVNVDLKKGNILSTNLRLLGHIVWLQCELEDF